jgi:hypothetical protein
MSLRMSMLLVVGGAALLATWIVSPASSTPQDDRHAPAVALDLAIPALTELVAETDRLAGRLATPPSFPPPVRDPFNFGAASRGPVRPAEPALEAAPAVVTRPRPQAPPLTAIVASADGTLRAVFALHDDIEIVGRGGVIGGIEVTEISSSAVALTDRATGASISVSLH